MASFLKQFFSNLFNCKNAKLGFNVDFVNGYVNYNEITKIKKGKCVLNFENQQIIITQNNESISDYMSDVYNFRTWNFKGNVYFAIKMKTSSEYKFCFGNVDFWLKALENYTKAFNIPFEYCGESGENDNE